MKINLKNNKNFIKNKNKIIIIIYLYTKIIMVYL